MRLKYDMHDSLEEVLRRSRKIRKTKEKNLIRGLQTATAVLTVALVAVFYRTEEFLGTEATDSLYGSFMISRSGGIYVLIGLICFIAGVILTLWTLSYRKRR